MAKHRSHSIVFKRQIAQEFLAGETLHGLAKRHDLSRRHCQAKLGRRFAPAYRQGRSVMDAIALVR